MPPPSLADLGEGGAGAAEGRAAGFCGLAEGLLSRCRRGADPLSQLPSASGFLLRGLI